MGLALPLAGVAYASSLWRAGQVSLERAPAELEGLFFEPQHFPTGLALALAGWFAWRSRGRLAALPATDGHVVARSLWGLGVALAVWSALNGAPDWMLASLLASGLAFVGSARGLAGVRATSCVWIALLFGLPIPDPLENELLWLLQRIAAEGTLLVHGLLSLGTAGEGVMLHRGESGFLVIESCSGLRSLLTLTLVALVVWDLLPETGRRGWWILAAAPLVACLANVVRVAWIATADAASSAAGHVGQGVATLAAGSLVLFVLGLLLARGREAAPAAPARGGAWPWRALCLALLATGVAHAVTPTWPRPARAELAAATRFGDRRGWVGEDLQPDRQFIGTLALGVIVKRRFARPAAEGVVPEIVELFVGFESALDPRRSPFSSKLALPGRDWSIRERRTQWDTRLFREVEVAVASRAAQRALVQTWRPGSESSTLETLRSFLALERGPFARSHPRSVVRIATPLYGEEAKHRAGARERLDRFLIDFGADLEALETGG